MTLWLALVSAAAAAWFAVLIGRHRFWWPGPWLAEGDRPPARDAQWPTIVAIVPARDEAAVLSTTLPTLAAQDYPGHLEIVVVDDESSDGTFEEARRLLAETLNSNQAGRRSWRVLRGEPTAPGWAGKVWALEQGRRAARDATWLWLTDADITHHPATLRYLVSKAETDRRDLVSVMAVLRAQTLWEKLIVPAFVYFFALLYPFRRVASGKVGAAAGGCILVKVAFLEEIGGLASIATATIDDVALAGAVRKAGGRCWLGFHEGVRSVREYSRLSALWSMISRSAFTQLRHSWLALAGVVTALALMFAVPPAALTAGAINGDSRVAVIGALTWGSSSASLVPLLRRVFGLSFGWSVLLPVVGLLYAAMTVSSAWSATSGRPIPWRGRPVSVATRHIKKPRLIVPSSRDRLR